jgi:hypothetical protein
LNGLSNIIIFLEFFFGRWPPVSRAPARTRRPRWMFDGKYPEAGGAVYKRGQGQSGSSIDYLRFMSQIIASNAGDDAGS